MRSALLLMGALLAGTATAQTTNDDMVATETWWDEVGAGFFSDEGLQTVRPEYEIRAHWTGLSADDQAAVRARCAENAAAATAPSLQEGSEDESPAATEEDLSDIRPQGEAAPQEQANGADRQPEATATGSVDGQEVQTIPEDLPVEPYTGLAGGIDAQTAGFAQVCELIKTL